MDLEKKFNNITYNFEESWVNIQFDDPSSKNALSENMINELNDLLNKIDGDDNIRGITFKGSNGIFCSGANLKEINEIFDSNDPKVKAHNISTSIGKLLKST